MNKIFMFYVFIILSMFSITVAQTTTQEKYWEDGNPTYTRTRSESEIYIGSYVSLAPLYSSLSDDALDMVLEPIDWYWPLDKIPLKSVEDIDCRMVGGQSLYLVTDPQDRQVFEINADRELKIWSYQGPDLGWPVDACGFDENTNFKVLITDKVNNKILIYNTENLTVEWEYGGMEGSGPNQLSDPMDAVKIPGEQQYLVADKGNDRVIIIDYEKVVIWEYGDNQLDSPVDVEYLPESNEVLITDQGNNRILIVDRMTKQVNWVFGDPAEADSTHRLQSPADADVLSDGSILIADAGNNRIIQVDREGNIVWQFSGQIAGLRDVDRVADFYHLAVFLHPTENEFYPFRLGYSTASYITGIYDLNREVNFDKLLWEADVLGDCTSVQLELRSAISRNDIDVARWYGPTVTENYYTHSGTAANPIHNGHRFCQIRATLITNNPMYTPTLKKIKFDFHFYNTKSEKTPYFYSDRIQDPDGHVISKWKTLEFHTILPRDPAKRDAVSLEIKMIDPNPPGKTLASFSASITDTENKVNLESISQLVGIQSVILYGLASTSNSSVTPGLDDWKLVWDAVPVAFSGIKFIDRNGNEAPYYRAPDFLPHNQSLVDSLDIRLYDLDRQPFVDNISILVRAAKSGDSERVELVNQEFGSYRLIPRIPLLVVTSKFVPNNSIMEVFDRDTLVVSYTDPVNPSDVSVDSISIIKNTTGKIAIENYRGDLVRNVKFDDVLYVHVFEEYDRNITPDRQDSITVALFDRVTDDEERIILYEKQSSDGVWNSGDFYPAEDGGIRIVKDNNGLKNDGQIQAMPGHRITAEYVDNIMLSESALLPTGPDTLVSIYLEGEPYTVKVAPNPYFENRSDNFRMLVASASASLYLRRLEIYNLAGEKVRDIDGNTIVFDTGSFIPEERFGIAEHWWNLYNDNGHKVSSGTYWLKVHADLRHEDTNETEQVVFFRKFVIIR
ncbi:hypothetical protein JW935_06885 [candidate division KSB1 bacterium]|nr:hypothetical protein [candidate division KSB1 bacterium]